MAWLSKHAWLMTLAVAVPALIPPEAEAQSRRRPPANYIGGHTPNQVEGARILENMREVGVGGAYYQEFELRLLPRKAAESRMPGRWFGDRNAAGPITRLELYPTPTQPEVLLVQNGPEPMVWRLAPDTAPARLEGAALMEPLAGTTMSAADLQLPFMFWQDFVYEGREEVRGRPAYIFLLYPSAAEAEKYPGIGGARVFIDTQVQAPIQAQWIGEAGEALKTITVISLKKVSGRYIVKSFEVRDERTRDKTRLVVTAVALDLPLPEVLFTPEGPGGAADLELPPEALVPVR